jgi:hypothetical protein
MVIWPNPVRDAGLVQAQVTLPSPAYKAKLKLFTLSGRKIYEETIGALPQGSSTLTIPLNDNGGAPIANGLYYVVVNISSGNIIGKLLITR